jgi:hypothetical protein
MRTCFLVLAALVAGCHWDLNSKSTDPQADQLYFPAGIAMDPNGRFAYVSNGNADLRYGGGTVMMLDMLSFECTIAEARRQMPLAPSDASTELPAACADAGGDYHAFWAQVASDAQCQRDVLDPSIIDCDESGFIFQNSTVAVGNFAGAIRLLPDPDDANHRTLFVAVRGDPSITRIDVHFPGSSKGNPGPDGNPLPVWAPLDLSSPGVLQCFDDPSSLKARPQYDATTHKTSGAPPCDPSALVQDYQCQNEPTCLKGTDQNDKTQLPTEPFGMQIDTMSRRLVVSHLATGQVSVINIDAAPANALLSESVQFFPPDATARHGAFAVAQQTPSDPHSLWYLTSNVNAQIATFRIADAGIVIPQGTVALNNSFAQGTDVRDFVFDNGGNRAFLTEANPPSVLVLDTRTDVAMGSQPHNTVTDIVNVCQTPSHTGVRRFVVAGAPGTPPRVKTKIMVVCFLSNQLMIVDPDRPGVDETMFSGFGGPNDITFNFSDPGVPNPIAQLAPRHAYVTNYSDSTIAVVDLEPGSITENQVLARLGMPPDGFNP